MAKITFYVQKLRSNIRPRIASFFSGLFWPFTWLESKSASFGLLVSLFILIVVASVFGVITSMIIIGSESSDSSSSATGPEGEVDRSKCNVVGIEIRDCIWSYTPKNVDGFLGSPDSPCYAITSAEDVSWTLEGATNDSKIKAIVFEIDSSGGSPYAAEEIAASMKTVGKPTIAWVRENADSAAYWIASAADTIIAGENSEVGSIGVTSSYVDNSKQNAKDGLTYNQLTTGKYKDMGTPDRALTADDRSLMLRDLNIILQNFIREVSVNRHLSTEKVTALADGSTMLGRQALHNGLIDQIGTKAQVWEKLESIVGEKPDVCWY